ncbi:hypothetical protein CEXT_140251 [Caerostris extrusa]|uniref:Uncharacterized protein n=1 Tax=Caerostris extrusa TaxID=172846 RepID=A0AAV4XM48_CAEEX|nr:hypothetical protein CEXT_140251 [Caerostris extrusa]
MYEPRGPGCVRGRRQRYRTPDESRPGTTSVPPTIRGGRKRLFQDAGHGERRMPRSNLRAGMRLTRFSCFEGAGFMKYHEQIAFLFFFN